MLPKTCVQQNSWKEIMVEGLHDPCNGSWKVPNDLLARHRFSSQKILRNFYLITDVQTRTCDYRFHMKWEVSWTSSLLKYRAKCVKMEGERQLNWQFAKLDMFKKRMKMSAFGHHVVSYDKTALFCIPSSTTYAHSAGGQDYLKHDIHVLSPHTDIYAHVHMHKDPCNRLKLTLCASRRGRTTWGSWRVQL